MWAGTTAPCGRRSHGSHASRFRHRRQRRGASSLVERRPAGCFAGRSILFRVRRYGRRAVCRKDRTRLSIRDITVMPDGRIALLRDGGWVYFLSRSARYCNEEARKQRNVYSVNCDSIAASPALDSPGAGDSGPAVPPLRGNLGRYTAAGAQLFDQHCRNCHNLNAEQHSTGPHGVGPHLFGVIGRRAARSEASDFRLRSIRWTSSGRRNASSSFSLTRSSSLQARPCRRLALAKRKPAP